MGERTDSEFSNLTKRQFGGEFVWGVSTAAYQIEGACQSDDKGESIWDRFVKKKGAIYRGEHGDIACDFYNRYEQDIQLMQEMNLRNFRFSISWTRVIPNGYGTGSRDGIDFYNRVIDFCLERGITPWVTLYHWDLPQKLEELGGWANRDILGWFESYVSLCARHFGDRVRHWMVLNEPMVFTGAGYFLGVHAPGKKGFNNFLPSVHHACLCQAIGGKVLRSLVPNAVIGSTFSCSQVDPYTAGPKDWRAALRVDALLNRLFLEPALGLGYPTKELPLLKRMDRYKKPDDEGACVFDFDFIGVQNYTREVVRHSYTVPYLNARIIKATKRGVKTTLMDWEVYPPSLYAMIAKYSAYKGVKRIIVTENGAAFPDVLDMDEVDDPDRLAYFIDHLKQVLRAKSDGLKVDGYFAWTFTDNFEWAEGFTPRFGLVYVDFKTQRRIIKSSGKWFRDFLGTEV